MAGASGRASQLFNLRIVRTLSSATLVFGHVCLNMIQLYYLKEIVTYE